jgi:hypothetical protein
MDLPQQTKKNQLDPDFDQLNPDIVKLGHTNGWIRQSLILYLTGAVTWTEALELMVTTVHKEFKLQQSLLNTVIEEKEVPHDLLVAYAKRTHKALPPPKVAGDEKLDSSPL